MSCGNKIVSNCFKLFQFFKLLKLQYQIDTLNLNLKYYTNKLHLLYLD